MKVLLSILCILILPGNLSIPEGIEYNHRKIAKEISKTFDLENYDLIEMNIKSGSETENRIDGKFYSVESNGKSTKYAYIGRVFTCPKGGCDEADRAVTTEYFDYLILFTGLGEVAKISVFNYQATHGQEVCSRGWLGQFNGFKAQKALKVGKNIDAISGATKSTNSITTDISRKTLILHQNI